MIKREALYSSKNDEYTTPDSVYDALNKEFDFNLDPCSTDENAKCLLHYTKEDDGLHKSWGVPGVLQSPVLRDNSMGKESLL